MLWFITMLSFLSNADSTLSFIETGKGNQSSVIFVHGTPGSKKAFKNYYEDEEFQELFHMISVDRLGFGESSKKAETSLLKHAKSIQKLIQENWPDKNFSCVGHSYGVPVCLYLFLIEPERFVGGVMMAGVSNPNRKILRWYNYWANTWFVRLFLSKSFENSNEEMKALKTELYKLEPLLSQVKNKILIIHGQEDKIVPFSDSHHLKKALKNAELKTLSPEKMGHLFLWTQKEYLKNELKIFLNALDVKSSQKRLGVEVLELKMESDKAGLIKKSE